MTDFPDARPTKPLWLITLADLALLLVGFLVLVQATSLDKAALAQGLRSGFGVEPQAIAMPVAAAALSGFAPGSATLAQPLNGLADWARDAARDPRVKLNIAGRVDGSPLDTDRATGAGALLAADRARAVAAALVAMRAIAPDRINLSTSDRPGQRQVLVTLSFTGDQK
jgi:hypothetical protein